MFFPGPTRTRQAQTHICVHVRARASNVLEGKTEACRPENRPEGASKSTSGLCHICTHLCDEGETRSCCSSKGGRVQIRDLGFDLWERGNGSWCVHTSAPTPTEAPLRSRDPGGHSCFTSGGVGPADNYRVEEREDLPRQVFELEPAK